MLRRLPWRPIVNYLKKEMFADIRNKNYGVRLWVLMRRIQIRMLAISYSLLKITWVTASFPHTSFAVPAHAEDTGGLENGP